MIKTKHMNPKYKNIDKKYNFYLHQHLLISYKQETYHIFSILCIMAIIDDMNPIIPAFLAESFCFQ